MIRTILIFALASAMAAANAQGTTNMKHGELTPRQEDLAACASLGEKGDMASHGDWPKGKPNTAYASYFTGQSYLAPLVPKNLHEGF